MDSLKKELEEELKLSTDDPRSHAWYHGPLNREVHIRSTRLSNRFTSPLEIWLFAVL